MTATSLAFRFAVALDVLAVMFYTLVVLALAVAFALVVDNWQRQREARRRSEERQRVLARSKQLNAEDDGLLSDLYDRRLDDRSAPHRRSTK